MIFTLVPICKEITFSFFMLYPDTVFQERSRTARRLMLHNNLYC
ncbi:MAG TPA: hypothetical protein V6D15_16130 [Oculatellaceae cyanobacterium]